MTQVYKLKLEKPAFLDLVSHDEKYNVTIDLFEANQLLENSDKQPDKEAKWNAVIGYMATKLGCDRKFISRSNAYDFWEHVAAAAKHTVEVTKKKCEAMLSSPTSTLESPTTTT